MCQYGADIEMVVMGTDPKFKSAVRHVLGELVIGEDGFHYCRYIYWGMDEVSGQVQKEWGKYKRVCHVF